MALHDPANEPTLAQRQAEWIARISYEEIPAEVLRRARQLLLDYLGVATRGATLPQVEPARMLLEIMDTRPEATVIGGGRATAPYAAYANGTFGHSCEYDDSHFDCGHPGVCVIPAALAIAERIGADGKALLVAIVAQAGLTGPMTIFEGLRGIHRLFTEGKPKDPESFWDGSFHIMNTMVKLHAMVGTVHAPLDALDMVLARRPATAAEIEHIEVGMVAWAIPHGAAIVHPHDMIGAQFSLAFAFALRIIQGHTAIADLVDPARWADEAIKAMASKIRPVPMEVPEGAAELCGRVTIRFTDGTSESAFQFAPRGYPANPATEDDIKAKFFGVTRGILDDARAKRIVKLVEEVDALPQAADLLAAFG